MYQPVSNACNEPNGLQPVPAQVVARARRQLAKVNAGETRARNAVLGYCTNPAPYIDFWPNIAAEIASSPSIPEIVANMTGTDYGQVANGVTATGITAMGPGASSGASPLMGGPAAAPGCWNDAPVNTIPIQGTNPRMPPVPPRSLPDRGNAGLGDYPPWGDQFQNGGAATLADVSNWFLQNPGVTLAAILFGVAILFGKK
jgi:hypothetical protein